MAAYCLAAVGRQIVEIAVPGVAGGERDKPTGRSAGGATEVSDAADVDAGCACCEGGESGEQRRAVCMAVLDHLYSGQPTGKPELDGFSQIAEQFALPRELWDRLVEGLIERSAVRRYATWGRLRDHLERTAGTAGRLAVRVLIDRSLHGDLSSSVDDRVLALGTGMGLVHVLGGCA